VPAPYARAFAQASSAQASAQAPVPSAGSARFLHISAANLASSAIFALAHFAIGFHPARLAVFFPSLLFGRLAERTGGIAASVTLHVLSNLMMQFVSTQYLP
jgi:membrane protease YdiL (CAAX protease family)